MSMVSAIVLANNINFFEKNTVLIKPNTKNNIKDDNKSTRSVEYGRDNNIKSQPKTYGMKR